MRAMHFPSDGNRITGLRVPILGLVFKSWILPSLWWWAELTVWLWWSTTPKVREKKGWNA